MVNPTIRSGPCGVYDFACLMADGFRGRYGCAVEIAPQAVKREALRAELHLIWGEGSESVLPERLEDRVREHGRIDTLILQYSGYGFDPSGAPAGLPKDLARFRERYPETRLATYFHELYAVSPIWTRGYWNAPRQRAVVRDLARMSDISFTNCAEHQRRLREEFAVPPERLVLQPVASNVGEPAIDEIPAFAGRDAVAVVFGGQGIRKMVFNDQPGGLSEVLRKFSIRRIVEIGPGESQASAAFAPLVDFLGILDADEVSRRMLAARYGLISYPADFLGKSTVFSAYRAHGLVTINRYREGRRARANPAMAGIVDWVNADAADGVAMDGIAREAVLAYRQHSAAALVDAFAQRLGLGQVRAAEVA